MSNSFVDSPVLSSDTSIQPAVFPIGAEWENHFDQYPYFSDFEPKKREIIETVTDTGELLNQSSQDANVRKSTTTADRTEQDYYHFENYASSAKKSITGGDVTEITQTIDPSKVRRENYSYTSTISQLYQVLDSYHVGTNRALFLINARPYFHDSIYSFVNGPRRLEGIQDFFLVVRRPKQVEGICVRAKLETAHLDLDDTSGDATLFITAREVFGCIGQNAIQILPGSPWVEYEVPLPQSATDLLKKSRQTGRDAVDAANALSLQVREGVINSFRTGNRYAPGEVDFFDTDFVMRKLIAHINPEAWESRPELFAAVKRIRSSLSRQSQTLTSRQIQERRRFVGLLGTKIGESYMTQKQRKGQDVETTAEEGDS